MRTNNYLYINIELININNWLKFTVFNLFLYNINFPNIIIENVKIECIQNYNLFGICLNKKYLLGFNNGVIMLIEFSNFKNICEPLVFRNIMVTQNPYCNWHLMSILPMENNIDIKNTFEFTQNN